ncbi:hypothetical protein [Candidatus Sulfurimonas baltica]|uniref:Uncharacterized protein n=1 Tax=Candidatus Sulfurimonas baltica TaxID=2740404 RepID=A0A7S7LXB2_9BACT|nr:hypothetical protein [Candidatus Sulfurimonas baltica]QOY53062.1 hypothetical protein HUE88_05120 [Candidatus Sulfurimonas baltica]
MIIKSLIITLSLTLSAMLFNSISWFESEQQKIIQINKEHIRDIRKLKKISQINTWLDDNIKPSIVSLPENDYLAEENLVSFFDSNAKNLNFKVNKYIYDQGVSKHLDVYYEIDRDNKAQLKALIEIQYQKGFIRFKELNVREKIITGEIQILQIYKGDNNES